MKTEELTDNQLIENFYVSHGGKPTLEADIPFYESDWNMLHPVIDKIADLWEPLSPMTASVENVTSRPIACHIQQAHKEVVNFIKWYNSHPQNGVTK